MCMFIYFNMYYIWIATGTGTNTIAYSYNGIDWTGLGTNIFSDSFEGIAWNGTMWVVGGLTFTNEGKGQAAKGKVRKMLFSDSVGYLFHFPKHRLSIYINAIISCVSLSIKIYSITA